MPNRINIVYTYSKNLSYSANNIDQCDHSLKGSHQQSYDLFSPFSTWDPIHILSLNLLIELFDLLIDLL